MKEGRTVVDIVTIHDRDVISLLGLGLGLLVRGFECLNEDGGLTSNAIDKFGEVYVHGEKKAPARHMNIIADSLLLGQLLVVYRPSARRA
jgi:hypothetical protein